MKKRKKDQINRRKFVSHVATGTVMAFGMGVMAPSAYAHGHHGGGDGSTGIFFSLSFSF
jgi:hypothetical protein